MNVTYSEMVVPDHASPEGERLRIDAGPSPSGSHEVGAFLFCERWWAFLKHSDIRGVYDPFVRGGLLHVALAHDQARYALDRWRTPIPCGDVVVRRADDLYTPLEALRLTALAYPTARGREHAAQLYPGCVQTVQKYLGQAAATRPQSRVTAVEVLVEAVLPGGYRHTARLDMEEVDPTGTGVRIVDHKTTSQPAAKARALYAASLQLSALHHFGRMRHGSNFRGVTLHLVRTATGVGERVPYNAPYLTADTPNLLARTRARMIAEEAQRGSDIYAYAPTGLGCGCKEANGQACPALSRCAFRTES